MNIQLLDSWIREYVETNATPQEMARCLSLCGPSFEKIEAIKIAGKKDYLYDIEVTTNRVDMMSVMGIAREASVILPEFGFKARFAEKKLPSVTFSGKSLPLTITMDKNLTKRVMGVIIDNIKNWETPAWMAQRLEASGFRVLGAPVDITNYVMTEIGHPTHVFDYDLISTHSMKIRESKQGEKVESLEEKVYTLPGGDIVIDDGTGKIIDLPGIIGTENSVVNKNTKRVLFFMETNDPVRIRKTSMTLGIRTVAATLNEKGVDSNLSDLALRRGVELFKQVCKASVASKVIDHNATQIKPKTVMVKHDFLETILGVTIEIKRVEKILSNLGFKVDYKKSLNEYSVTPPSWRTKDIKIAEDVIEEVARIYGYHNLPSTLMEGKLPQALANTPFAFERKVKSLLQSYGGVEVYNYSMTSKEAAGKNAIEIKNPLGSDSAYLRTTLKHTLMASIAVNAREKDEFHIFEMANIYLSKKDELPEERLILAGVIAHSNWRKAKGVVEALLDDLNIRAHFEKGKGSSMEIYCDKKIIGSLEVINDVYYYEFQVDNLKNNSKDVATYQPLPQNPPQIEDLTFELPEKTVYAQIVKTIQLTSSLISHVGLTDIYKNAYTFRIWYQSDEKTLTNDEVEKIRTKMVQNVEKKHAAHFKK